MQPLGLFDALATPMYDAFDSQPDNTEPYTAIPPNVDLLASATRTRARTAAVAGLNLDHPDRVPQRDLDGVLWKSVHGEDSKPPPPGPNAERRGRGGLRGREGFSTSSRSARPGRARAGARPTGAPPRAAPPARAACSSPAGGPTSCTPIGRPSSPWNSGSEIAGWPVTLQIAVNGVKWPELAEVVPGVVAAGVELADRHGRCGQRGREQEVVVVPERDDPARHARSAACARAGSRARCVAARPATSPRRAARRVLGCGSRPVTAAEASRSRSAVPNDQRERPRAGPGRAHGGSTSSTSCPSASSSSAASRAACSHSGSTWASIGGGRCVTPIRRRPGSRAAARERLRRRRRPGGVARLVAGSTSSSAAVSRPCG